jgi:hypothetical protein
MKIVEATPKNDFTLFIKSDDGRTGLFDVKPYLDSEVFAQLRNADQFERIRNGGYYIAWECGADLSVDTIEAHWKPAPEQSGNAQPSHSVTTRTSRN